MVVSGIIGGIVGTPDTVIDELGNIAETTINFDQNYVMTGIISLEISAIDFIDEPVLFSDCGRNTDSGPQPD